jgi:hypothetical protein
MPTFFDTKCLFMSHYGAVSKGLHFFVTFMNCLISYLLQEFLCVFSVLYSVIDKKDA